MNEDSTSNPSIVRLLSVSAPAWPLPVGSCTETIGSIFPSWQPHGFYALYPAVKGWLFLLFPLERKNFFDRGDLGNQAACANDLVLLEKMVEDICFNNAKNYFPMQLD